MPTDQNDVKRIDELEKAVFGDREDMKKKPGIVFELARTNDLLTELNATVRRINWLIITSVITGLMAVLFDRIG